MQLALAQAHEAAAAGEVPVGAVLVKDDCLIATGRNAPIADHDPTAHAEVVALREAARILGNYRLDGCTLYVTLEPCAMCSGAMLHARLARVVFGAPDVRTGAAGSVLNLFKQTELNHQTHVTGGVLADDCAQVLKDFFKPRRINAAPVREDALRTPDAAFTGLPALPGESVVVQDWPELDGLRLHYSDTHSGGAAQATLWLHGPQDWALAWRESILSAGEGRHIAADLIGFGRSDKPKKPAFHTLQNHAHVLLALCTHLGLQQVRLISEPAMQPLLTILVAMDAERFGKITLVDAPALSASERDVPYPDKGYRAGPRALAQALAQATIDPSHSQT